MLDSDMFYKEIFMGKVKYRNKILIDTSLKDCIINNADVIKDLKLVVHDSPVENTLYDVIILECSLLDENIKNIIMNAKLILKTIGIIMFFHEMISIPYFLKYSFNMLKELTNIDLIPMNFEKIYDIMKENGLKIIDTYRLLTSENYISNKDIFLISCTVK